MRTQNSDESSKYPNLPLSVCFQILVKTRTMVAVYHTLPSRQHDRSFLSWPTA